MINSRLGLLCLLTSCIFWGVSAQDTLLHENFDASPGYKPEGWTTELETGDSKWQFVNGGGTKNPEIQGSRKPPSAYSDTVNALYFFESLEGEEVILITPPINLEFAIKPELRFMHAQREGNLGFGLAHDELRVYYKTHFDSAWVESNKLAEFTDEVYDWTEQTILLPEDAHVPECYIGFRAKTNYGWGVCIDDVTVLETGVQQRWVDTIIIHQANTSLLPSGTNNNPVLRIDIAVKGNSGDVTLNSIHVTSLNSLDTDIGTDGVKLLYNYSSKNVFAAEVQDMTTFSSSMAMFNSLNFSLPTGNNYFWITYDVRQDAVHGNFADAMIGAGDIDINGSTYPQADASPAGSRLLQESVFLDDFTTDKGWTLTGDFERDKPGGLGGNFLGNPDPLFAAGDTMILGNDLTGLGINSGDYEANVSRYENLATSPSIDLYYYNDTRLNFLRWLNVANNDTVSIEMSTDDGSTWKEIWSNNNNVFTDGEWRDITQEISSASRKSMVKFRFNLGPTTPTDNLSGWNIENFAVTGNYVDYDVGPTALLSPERGCGHSSAETVSIRVKNFGPGATPDKIPVRYSFDGGTTFSEDTITAAIAFEGETDFDFTEKIDLSEPGAYNAIIETDLDVDEDNTNNTLDTVLYVDPAYTLPYIQNFESGTDFWRVEGISSFEYGTPTGGIIHTAASYLNAWVTNLDGNYLDNEDGYLLGPCFDFSGIDYPVFECMLFVNIRSEDGANLEYSLNNGQSWSRVGNLDDGSSYGWNWYNSDTIAALTGGHGWTGELDDWVMARILLDTTIFRNAPSVKFRFHFTSDGFGSLEGIGIDDIRIYDAPRDLGVVSIEYPINGCAQDIGEHVEVTIRNYGLDTLMAGDTIIIGYDFDTEPTVIDTFVLESNLLKNSTIPYTFKKSLAVYTSGFKDVKAFTLLPDDVDFYNETLTNDTADKSIEVTLTPFVNLPAEIYTVRPDTIVLNAYTGEPGDSYLWQDSSTDSVYHVTAIADSIYHVIASNAFCDYRDTTYVYRLIADVGVTQILDPTSDCELGTAVRPKIEVTNFGTDTIHAGDSIAVRYRIDGSAIVEEIAVLSQVVYPDSTFAYTFTTSSDMSSIKAYSVSAFTELAYDDTISNDTLHVIVEVYGYTPIDLGPDTVVRALQYTIDAGAGYDTYLWQNGSTNQTLVVDTTGQYRVTVKAGTQCENSDSLVVTIIIPDIGIERLSNPKNACGLTAAETVEMYVVNTGSDTLHTDDTLYVSYRVDTGPLVNDTLFVDRRIEPGDSILFSSSGTVDMSITETYQFTVSASYGPDLDPGNDSFIQSVEVYGYPEVSLGGDRIVNTVSDTLDAGGGFAAYLWHDGATGQQYIVEYENQRPDSTYSVTVTDDNGCQAIDEVKIGFDLWDLGITGITSPVTACRLTDRDTLKLIMKNTGTQTIQGDQIKINASFDGGIPRTWQKRLTLAMNPGDSLEANFGTFDLSAEGDHHLTAYFLDLTKDAIPGNDTLEMVISHLGEPKPDLGGVNDTLPVKFPYELNAGADYETYVWNGVSGSRTYMATEEGWYILEVTNLGCSGKDSVYLISSTGSLAPGMPEDLKVYPNPASGRIYIEYRIPSNERYFLNLFDARGRKLLVREYKQVNEIRESIDVSGLAKGSYYLLLWSGKHQIVRQIIIE